MGGCEVDDGSGMACSYSCSYVYPYPYPFPILTLDTHSFLQNFLHAGDHVHLGPGVTATRKTNPAVDLHDLPRIDLICLSHYHA